MEAARWKRATMCALAVAVAAVAAVEATNAPQVTERAGGDDRRQRATTAPATSDDASPTLPAGNIASSTLVAPAKPNVLYIIGDDMRPQWNVYCPTCGLSTPNLDALASDGLLFQRAHCQEAFCSASRNSFLTGRRPGTTLVWGYPVSFRDSPLGTVGTVGDSGKTWQSMPEYFKNHGYLSIGGGKTFHSGSPPNYDAPKSWSEPSVGGSKPFAYFPPRYGPSQGGGLYQVCCKQPFDPAVGCLKLADAGGGFCRVANESDIFDYQLTQHTIATLKQAKASGRLPFMIFVGYKKPHAPWGVPSRMFDLYEPLAEKVRLPAAQYRPRNAPNVSFITDFFLRLDNNTSFDDVYPWGPDQPAPDEVVLRNRQAYYATVSYVDEQVGKLIESLKMLQLRSSTIVVVHSDHGFQLGEHNEWEKKTNFELAARVPLLISVPWKAHSVGARTDTLVELVDVFPTLAALANLPPPPGLEGQGTNLAPLFDAPYLGAAFKNASFTNYPVCTAPGSAGRDYPEGSHFPERAGTHGCVFGGSATDRHYYKMGHSVRTSNWRYTAWVPWHGANLTADWSAHVAVWPHDGTNLINRELYDHRHDDGSEFDRWENTNLADDPEYKVVVEELHGILMQHYTTGCEQCCAKNASKCLAPPPPPSPTPRKPTQQCRGPAGFCECAATPSQRMIFAQHDSSITLGNGSAVASWSSHACDSVVLIATATSSSPAEGSSVPAHVPVQSFSATGRNSVSVPVQSFWVIVVDPSEFIDIGFCSASLDLTGRTWAGHQAAGKAFLYRSGGLFADSYITAAAPCGKGTKCGQGVKYGHRYAAAAESELESESKSEFESESESGSGSAAKAFFNVTAMKLSDTELEFLLDGVSQGKVTTKQPMPSDLVGCASACPNYREQQRRRGGNPGDRVVLADAAVDSGVELSLQRCAGAWGGSVGAGASDRRD